MDISLKNELFEFLADRLNRDLHEVNQPQFELSRDLGVAGTDGIELVESFAEKFSVDISMFNWSEYFWPEGFNLLNLLRSEKSAITVADLYFAASNQSWPQKTGRMDFDM